MTTPDEEDIQNDEAIGKALRLSVVFIGIVALAVLGVIYLPQLFEPTDEPEEEKTVALPTKREKSVKLPNIPLTDITSQAGIEWEHFSGRTGEKLLPETMGGGVAVLDYDADGDQDLLFVGGTNWPWAEQKHDSQSLCLYANDGSANFSDVTAQAGLSGIDIYGMGPAVGDFNNDGWVDLYITAVGANLLLVNNEGVFEDISDQSTTAGSKDAWSTAATWLDYDRDGLLDLFVCDYVVWNRELDKSIGFSLTGIGRAYGQPTAFNGTQGKLFHNLGNNSFEDVSERMGIHVLTPETQVPVGKGLAASAVDINRDGWTDIMVANDTVQNFLFLNQEGKGFEESAVLMGVAFDRSGNATGAMGTDCCFLRNDESLAIGIGNFANEQSSLYVSRGPNPPFVDNAMASGLGPQSRLNLTFGLYFADLDLDSRLDVVCSNGHLESEINKIQSTQTYAQSPQFFWNAGIESSSEFVPLSEEQVGKPALEPMVGRGATYADLDDDGDLDIILVENDGSPRILRNDQELKNNWLRVSLAGNGSTSNRSAFGAIVEASIIDGVQQRRVITASRSYLSQCEAVATFGLGSDSKVNLRITWPDGKTQEIKDVSCNQVLEVTQTMD